MTCRKFVCTGLVAVPKSNRSGAVSLGAAYGWIAVPRDNPEDSSTTIVQSSVAALTVNVDGRRTKNSKYPAASDLTCPPNVGT